MDPSRLEADSIDFVGDAQILLTGPFFPSADPLEYRPPITVPSDEVLDANGRLVLSHQPMDRFLRGSLTYGNPKSEPSTQFIGSERFNSELAAVVEPVVRLPLRLTVTGMLFPDGYGSVAVRIDVPDGWEPSHRERLLNAFGPKGRDPVADTLRDMLLPTLAEMADRCSPDARRETLLPYFNLTYTATTTHPLPGRGTLPHDLRPLIYPRSPAPITSNSPWADEFFFAGYAFLILASAAPGHTLDQLERLLLHLNVLYARMDQSAAAADRLIREPLQGEDINWLLALDRRLRADYQALVRPTFSYDHHVLKLRDSLLHAWETDKVRERTETLLQMARQAVERQLAQQQARRVARVNRVITILTLFSFMASVEAVVDLWVNLFGRP